MIEKRLRELWERLQGKKPHFQHFLAEIGLKGIRGIDNLRTVLDYPVSVIAGGNASGKSTVLFAAACAYRVPGAGVKDFVPSTLFPDYRPKSGKHEDHKDEVVIDFDYATPEGRRSMRWKRSKGWNRSFLGRKNAKQPERSVYLRTLSNLSNPSEVRGVLSISRPPFTVQETALPASQIEFAQRMLPFRYSEVVSLSNGSKNLLFAIQQGGASYSELHMSAGERAILRLSQEIAQLQEALVLIDEVEAGLHPWVQQLLMLHLQQLALRNNLQIIVTSHSPVVLDSVPTNGRIFLERNDSGQVTVRPPYRDIVQNALYGRSGDALNVLCEDETAEGILRGIFDILFLKHRIRNESIRIGRDTGAEEFPNHAAAFRKFGQIDSFIFVLDGDKQDSLAEKKLRAQAGDDSVLFLPGEAPEVWTWNSLKGLSAEEVDKLRLGTGAGDMAERMKQLDSIYEAASDPAAQIAKTKLRSLAEALNRRAPDIARAVGRLKTEQPESDIQPLAEYLENALLRWRAVDISPR